MAAPLPSDSARGPWSSAAAQFRDRGQFLQLAGLRVFVVDTGPAPAAAPTSAPGTAADTAADDGGDALLLLHGFPSSALDYHRILPVLSQRRRVVLVDFPGFGFSDKPVDYSYSLHEQADIVLLALRTLGIRSLALAAHDMGTSVACELLARRERGLLPVQITALCLMNGSVHIELAQLTPSQQLLRSPLGPLFSRLSTRPLFLAQLRRILGRPVPDEDLQDMWALLGHADGRLRLPQTIGYIAERHRYWHRWIGALSRLDIPTLILWGTEDPVAVRAIAQRLSDEIPGARLKWLNGVGHYPQLEDPIAVGMALDQFLDGRR